MTESNGEARKGNKEALKGNVKVLKDDKEDFKCEWVF